MSFDSQASGELESRLRRACVELDRRLREGETEVARELLASDPDIAAEEDFAIELIYTEFVTLEELGAEPSPHETLDRFPQWRDRLERLLKVHDAFRGDDDIDLKRSSDTLAGIDSTRNGERARSPRSSRPPGRHIGQYELLDEIDRGGMGIVYKARQQGLNRIVAVKSIRSADASESERVRFRAEAESAAKLQHPNIIQIYEVGEQDGYDFLSMEYIDGGSLEQRLARETPSVREAAKLIATLAEAIHFAHERGIVHRDLKPGNVLLASDTPKIGDFGLAKRMLAGAAVQTQTGAVLGTPCYMSPEQAEGRNTDIGPTTDIYSLGVILYEMLTGQVPFVGTTPLETLDLIRTKEPAHPSTLANKVPRDLETICLKCLAKDSRHRYPTARELAEDLRCFLNHEPIHARRVSPIERVGRWAWRRPAISGLAATLLLVSAVGAVVLLRQQYHFGKLAKSAEATERKAAEIEERADEFAAEAGANLQKAKQAIERLSLLGATLHDQPGMGQTALETVEQALEQYEALLKQYGSEHSVRWEAARAYERAGFIQIELGRREVAEQTLLKGVRLFDRLGKTPSIDFERAGILIQLGHSQRFLGKFDVSEASYLAAIELLEDLNAESPSHAHYELRLANTLVNLSIAMQRRGQHDRALQAYVSAIRLQTMVIERTVGFKSTVAVDPSTSAIAEADVDEEAIHAEVLSARELRKRLVAEGADTLLALRPQRLLSELAISVDDLGTLCLRLGRGETGEIAIREALELRQLAVRQAEAKDWRQRFLARSHSRVGSLEYDRRNYEEAARAFEAAVVCLDELVHAFPHRVPYQSGLGTAYADLGRAQRRLKQFRESLLSHRKGVAIHERLLTDDPDVVELRDALATSLYHMARALNVSGHTRDAIPVFKRSLDLNSNSARANNALAWMLVMAPDHSLRDPQYALPLAQRAVELVPRSGSYWNTLGVAYYRNDDHDQTVAALMRSIELRDGGDGFDWFFLAMSHARQGNEDLANEWFERARTWCLTQDPLPDELERIQDEAVAALAELDD